MKYGRLGEADVCKIRRGREQSQPGMSIGRRAAIDSMRTRRAMKGMVRFLELKWTLAAGGLDCGRRPGPLGNEGHGSLF